jgi:hypothetical protein
MPFSINHTRRRLRALSRLCLRRLRRGIALNEEPSGHLAGVDEATRALLRAYQPVVAIHRGGNLLARLASSVSGDALIETDVRLRRGELVVAHEHWLGPLAYDWPRRFLRLGDRPIRLPRLLSEAKRLNARLLLDLKLDAAWVPALIGQLRQNGLLETTAFTGEWAPLDAIAASGAPTQGLYYGSINRPWRLYRFLDEQRTYLRPAVSLHKRLATAHNLQRLHAVNARALVYVVSEPQEALELLARGADGLITNNLTLAEVWAEGGFVEQRVNRPNSP